MTGKSAVWLARAIFALSVLFLAINGVFQWLNREVPASGTWGSGSVLVTLAFATVVMSFPVTGLILTSRQPRNAIGWILLAIGVAWTIPTTAYAAYTFSANPGSLPFGPLVLAFDQASWIPPVGLTGTFLILLFPDGHLPSRRWRPVAWVLGIGMTLAWMSILFAPGTFGDSGYPHVHNPLGVPAALAGPLGFIQLFILTVPVGFILCASALVLRFRRSAGVERQQLRWLAAAASVIAVAYAFAMIATLAFASNDPIPPGWVSLLQNLALFTFALIPIAIGFAILKYRLYDIDVVINKAVVYGALAVFIGGAYVGIVVGIGALFGQGDKPNVALSIAATAVVALAFQPLRTRVQRFANRLVYGKRATPYEVMSGFSHRMAGTVSLDQLLPQMAEATAQGVGASASRVRLILPDDRERVVRWPSDSDTDVFDRVIPVSYQKATVGEIAVAKPAGEPLAPAEDKLLDDLAAQAGLAMHNARLTAELQARLEELSRQSAEIRISRQRIVAARDAALRQLERDIKGGTQQQLLAISARIRSAADLMERDPAVAGAMLDELGIEANDALETLRDLARGIFPPLLADKGLVAALEAHINKTKMPAMLRTDGSVGRYNSSVEAAVYFCCIEAMQNASKYAGGSPILATLEATDHTLAFDVSDDGPGFDPAAIPHRSGLQQMADRVEALEGTLEITSERSGNTGGGGTHVAGRIPIWAKQPGE